VLKPRGEAGLCREGERIGSLLRIGQLFAGIDEAQVLHRVPFAWVQARRDDTHIPEDLVYLFAQSIGDKNVDNLQTQQGQISQIDCLHHVPFAFCVCELFLGFVRVEPTGTEKAQQSRIVV